MLRVLAVVAILVAPAAVHADRAMCGRGAKYHGAMLDLDVKDADVHDVMRLLADVGNINIVVADSVRARVTLHLRRVPWDQVACTIAAVHRLAITVQDNVVLVRPAG